MSRDLSDGSHPMPAGHARLGQQPLLLGSPEAEHESTFCPLSRFPSPWGQQSQAGAGLPPPCSRSLLGGIDTEGGAR